MYWTFELADCLNEAPWPATRQELLDFCNRSGTINSRPEMLMDVIENLKELPDDETIIYYSMEDIWPERSQRIDYYSYYGDSDNDA